MRVRLPPARLVGWIFGQRACWKAASFGNWSSAGSTPACPTMNVDTKELEKINEKMVGWTVDRVETGTGETVFIVHLSKGKNKRSIKLCANDLGGWMGK